MTKNNHMSVVSMLYGLLLVQVFLLGCQAERNVRRPEEGDQELVYEAAPEDILPAPLELFARCASTRTCAQFQAIIFEGLKEGKTEQIASLLPGEECLLSIARWPDMSVSPPLPRILLKDMGKHLLRAYTLDDAAKTRARMKASLEHDVMTVRKEAELQGFSWDDASLERVAFRYFHSAQEGEFTEDSGPGNLLFHLTDGNTKIVVSFKFFPHFIGSDVFLEKDLSEEECRELTRLSRWLRGESVDEPQVTRSLGILVRHRFRDKNLRLWHFWSSRIPVKKRRRIWTVGPDALDNTFRLHFDDSGFIEEATVSRREGSL